MSVAVPSPRKQPRWTTRLPRRVHQAPPAVRLTRRGRAVVTLLLVGVVLALFVVFSGYSAASGEAGAEVATTTIVVDEGDTLWDIASSVAKPGKTREVVHQIQELNGMPTPALVEGQKLAVPVG